MILAALALLAVAVIVLIIPWPAAWPRWVAFGLAVAALVLIVLLALR